MTANGEQERVAIIGAGTMGRGIAQVTAAAGLRVQLYDAHQGVIESAISRIADSMARRVEKGKMRTEDRRATLDNIRPFDDLRAASDGASFVLEAVPEQIDVKLQVLSTARDAARSDAILGSNTSSLSITELGCGLDVGARTIGMHFFNPPPALGCRRS